MSNTSPSRQRRPDDVEAGLHPTSSDKSVEQIANEGPLRSRFPVRWIKIGDHLADLFERAEKFGHTAFEFMFHLAELFALCVFFAVAAAVTRNVAAEIFYGILLLMLGLYIASTVGWVLRRIAFHPRVGITQLVIVVPLALVLGVSGFVASTEVVSAVAAIAKTQLDDR